MTNHVVEVIPVPAAEKGLLRNLMQAYRHDLSEFTGDGPNRSGSFGVGGYNVPAQQFWRRVITAYTGGSFEEAWSESQPVGPQQTFVSPSASP